MEPQTAVLPERVEGPDGLLIRRWLVPDAEALGDAIAKSLEHLRPWMDWVGQEPLSVDRRRAMIEGWNQGWADGGDVVLGVFLDGEVAGGCGLHRRIGPAGLEMGYWIGQGFLRRGLATSVARALTDAALDLPDVSYVEIHHDKANVASAGVPRKIGFRLVGEERDRIEAPAEVGIECRWRADRAAWRPRY